MRFRCLLSLAFCSCIWAQQQPDSQAALMSQILQRLDALEHENRELINEVSALRKQLAATSAPSSPVAADAAAAAPDQLEDRVGVAERRIAEQAQTKVEASQKFPVTLNGMLLFNAFDNSASPVAEAPGYYLLPTSSGRAGATVRQTLLGLDFQGPSLPGGGRVNGFVSMDFWAAVAGPEKIGRAHV